MKTGKLTGLTLLFVFSFWTAFAQTDVARDSLALKLQNPLAKLVVFPINIDYNYGFEPHDGSRVTVQLEPVIPAKLSENWRMIIRAVAPFVTQSDIVFDGESETGLRDFTISAFFVPTQWSRNGLSFGFGPVIALPTATNDFLGAEKWSLGPTAVLLKQANKFTAGVLVNQSWSVAGNSDRADVSTFLFQPFVSQVFNKGWSILGATEILQDWKNDSTNGTVYVLAQKLLNLGALPLQCAIGPAIPIGNGNTSDFGFRIRLTATL
ncbi:MAG: transporter [Bacteroidota bacterium]